MEQATVIALGGIAAFAFFAIPRIAGVQVKVKAPVRTRRIDIRGQIGSRTLQFDSNPERKTKALGEYGVKADDIPIAGGKIRLHGGHVN